jgi:hypothetical protein
MVLTRQEKALYQQIHPAKLATDWSTTILAAYLLWRHELLSGLTMAVLPAVVATAVVMAFADLEKAKGSALGRYVRTYMTRSMQAVRSIGAVILLVGAWFQISWALPLGVIVILLGWLRGVLAPVRKSA